MSTPRQQKILARKQAAAPPPVAANRIPSRNTARSTVRISTGASAGLGKRIWIAVALLAGVVGAIQVLDTWWPGGSLPAPINAAPGAAALPVSVASVTARPSPARATVFTAPSSGATTQSAMTQAATPATEQTHPTAAPGTSSASPISPSLAGKGIPVISNHLPSPGTAPPAPAPMGSAPHPPAPLPFATAARDGSAGNAGAPAAAPATTETAGTVSMPQARVQQQGKGYNVQIGVFHNPDNAHQLTRRLKKAGVAARTETRVRIGPFSTREQAQRAMQQLKRLNIPAEVMQQIDEP